MDATELDLSLLRLDGGTQPREELDQFTVDAYAEALREGVTFPPVVVFYDDVDYWLADGFHREAAHRSLERAVVLARVCSGTQRDAVLYAVGANATHGKARTNADKRRAVITLLRDDEWSKWSDREIARRCAVSNSFVTSLRAALNEAATEVGQKGAGVFRSHLAGNNLSAGAETHRGADGKSYPAKRSPSESLSDAVRELLRHTEAAENPVELRALTRLDPALQQEVAQSLASGITRTVSEATRKVRAERKAARAGQLRSEPPPLPEGPFRTIVVDPPWRYDNTVGSSGLRGLTAYPDMGLDELLGLPVDDLAHADSVLWLWTTNAFMRDAFACLEAWAFAPKTILTWDKQHLGTGHWLRNVTEHCLLAVRGRPTVELTNQTTLICERRRQHSRKPESFYDLVDSLCPGSKLEMFARGRPRSGWTHWGSGEEDYDA